MKITVNSVPTINELCDVTMMLMQEEALEKHPKDLPFPSGIIQEYPDGKIAYTEEAQAKFNELFTMFLEVFEDNKITQTDEN